MIKKIDNLKEIFHSLNSSSFIISEQEKEKFRNFIESSDQFKKYICSRKITTQEIVNALDSKKNHSKTKHDLILSFSMFQINEKFKEIEKTFIVEPEYRYLDCLLNSPDFICCFKDMFNFSMEIKTKLDEYRFNKALKQIGNSFKFDPKCDFGFITTMKKKELKLFPVVDANSFDESEFKVYEKRSIDNLLVIKKL